MNIKSIFCKCYKLISKNKAEKKVRDAEKLPLLNRVEGRPHCKVNI
jgi:hypothetical protein